MEAVNCTKEDLVDGAIVWFRHRKGIQSIDERLPISLESRMSISSCSQIGLL
jgi:hypothetical protein